MEILEEIAKKSSPSMRERLEDYERRKAKRKEKAMEHIEEDCETLGIPFDERAEEFWESVTWAASRKKACDDCRFTVENHASCKYIQPPFYLKDAVNAYQKRLAEPCPKSQAYEEKTRIDRLLNRSGMGERFKRRTFATFQRSNATEDAYQACLAFCNNYASDSTGILLIGGYGCGKTHLAAAIIHQMAEYGIAGMFVVVPDLLAKIRVGFNTNDGTSNQIIEAAKNSKLLVMDDLGAENATDWVLEQLYLIVNHRYEHMLPTIITTNCKGQELEKKLGRRTLSRIAEMTTPIQIQAEDYRMRKFA